MSLNNLPNLPIAIPSPINTINRRQRSNTSPTQSLSALSAEPANDASLPHPSAPTPDHYYELPQLTREGEQRQEQQSLIGNNGNPTHPLSSSSLSPHTRSLKREANSPVYLDHHTISLASSNNHSFFFGPENNTYLTRRVVQCNSDRIRSSDSDVTSISSQDETFNFQQKSSTAFKFTIIKYHYDSGIICLRVGKCGC
jgi:hypothetical protein